MLSLLLALLCCSTLIGLRAAAAADETEATTTEEPPPVVETPTEPEPEPAPEPPPSETPVTAPPSEAPSAGEGGTPAPVESTKPPPSSGSQPAAGGAGGGGGGGGSSLGSGSSGAPTTSPGTTTTRQPPRVRPHPINSVGSSGGDGGGGSKTVTGGGGQTAAGGGGGRAPSHPAGGAAPQPTVSPQGIDEGASAVSHVAAHVGEVVAKALPTEPLKEIGTRVATQIAGVDPAQSPKERKEAVDRIGTALGAALIGSAVAVDRTPAANDGPIPFFDPPSGKSGTIYLLLIAALLLAVGALVFREVRSSLGLDAPRTGVRVADERPRIAARLRIAAALSAMRRAGDRWSSRFRRFRSNAVAGLRSLF